MFSVSFLNFIVTVSKVIDAYRFTPFLNKLSSSVKEVILFVNSHSYKPQN